MNIMTIYAKRYEIAALALWLTGVLTTYLFLQSIVETSNLLLFLLAFVVQLILTTLEAFAWTAQQTVAKRIGQVVFVFDALINAAALLPFVNRIDNTNVWYTISAYSNYSFYEIDGFLGFIIAFVCGAVIAIAPEVLLSASGKR